jgi:hypothetical protein
VLVAFTGLGACNAAPFRLDDTPGLTAIGFNKPFAVRVPLYNIADGQRGVFLTDDALRLALFLQAGYVTLGTKSDAAPWFRVTANTGFVGNGFFEANVAERYILIRASHR